MLLDANNALEQVQIDASLEKSGNPPPTILIQS